MASKIEMINELLKNFGEYYDPSPSWINGEGEVYTKVENFGLTLLHGRKWNNIVVSFENQEVYNVQANIYVKGVWEQILEEYYNKIPVILKNIEEEKLRRQRGSAIIGDITYLIPKDYSRLDNGNFSDTVQLSEKTRLTRVDRKDKYGYPETIINAIYLNDVVFQYRQYEMSGYYSNDTFEKYEKYVPGLWEDDVRKAARAKKQTRSLSNTYLEQLRNMQ